MISIPQFREVDFQDPNLLGEGNLPSSGLYSSTFRLADVLQMLPGQANHAGAIFHKKNVLELTDTEYFYRATCSRSGLARLLCRFFSSISKHENVVRVRTTLGLFELFNERLGVFVRFFPQSRAGRAHHLAGMDFDGVKKFAQGMFRLSDTSFRLALHRDAMEDERWQSAANQDAALDLFMMTPALDPHCIRFASPDDANKLRNKRAFAQLLMNSFLRLAAEWDEEPFPQFGLFKTVITQSSDSIFVHPDSVKLLSEAFWGLAPWPILRKWKGDSSLLGRWADFQEMEQDFIADWVGRHVRVRARLSALVEQHDVRYVAVLTSIALLVSMNCSITLTFSVESPRLWIEILSSPDAEIYIG
jgi:hypothetical protein